MRRFHPNIAEVYRQKVANLREALNDESTRTEAAECIRGLIEEIRLVQEKGKLRIDLFGELAALIKLANGHPAFWWNGGASNAGCGGAIYSSTYRPSIMQACLRFLAEPRKIHIKKKDEPGAVGPSSLNLIGCEGRTNRVHSPMMEGTGLPRRCWLRQTRSKGSRT
jgi:hypothetical protein